MLLVVSDCAFFGGEAILLASYSLYIVSHESSGAAFHLHLFFRPLDSPRGSALGTASAAAFVAAMNGFVWKTFLARQAGV